MCVFRWWNKSAKFCDFRCCFGVGFYDSDELIFANQLKKDLRWCVNEWAAESTERWEHCDRPSTRESLKFHFVELITCARSIHSHYGTDSPIRVFFFFPHFPFCVRRAGTGLSVVCYSATIANFTVFIGIAIASTPPTERLFAMTLEQMALAYEMHFCRLGKKQLNFDLVRAIRFTSNGEYAQESIVLFSKHHHRSRGLFV